jgi:hypothetical protein
MNHIKNRNYFNRLSEEGFTLVELAIAITLAMFITGVTYMVYITQQRSYVSQEQVGEMQSSTLVSLNMLTREIREAGFGIPTRPFNINGETQTIRVDDNTGENGSDILTIVGGFRKVTELAADATMENFTMITVKNDKPYEDKIKVFSAGQYINLLGVTLAQVTGVNEESKTLSLTGHTNIVAILPAGSPVYYVEPVSYQIEKRKENKKDTYELVRRSQYGMPNPKTTIAENIENMQVRLLDGNRRAEVHLLARTEGEDPIFENQGKKLVFDNATATWNEAGATDNYRRRLITLSVAIRN